MKEIKELNEEELEKITGGVLVEDRAKGITFEDPKIWASVNGASISITTYDGDLYDENGNVFRWTSYINSPDGLSTTYFFYCDKTSEIYSKTLTAEDNVITYLKYIEQFYNYE